MKLNDDEVAAMVELMTAVAAGNAAGLSANEAADFRFFVQKLHETGFF